MKIPTNMAEFQLMGSKLCRLEPGRDDKVVLMSPLNCLEVCGAGLVWLSLILNYLGLSSIQLDFF